MKNDVKYVYVLKVITDYEDTHVLGVYTTKQRAIDGKRRYMLSLELKDHNYTSYDDYDIGLFTLDSDSWMD